LLLSSGPDFVNVTTQAGILTTPISDEFSMSWTDVNGDGLPDLWVGRHGHEIYQPPNLYLNQGDGTFVDQFNQFFPDILNSDNHGSAWADFTNSGLPSFYQEVGANHGLGTGPKHFFVNTGGHLIDEAAAVGLLDPLGRGRDPAVFDWNNDGLLDLLSVKAQRPDGQAPSNLFAQTASGFQDVTAAAGLSTLSSTNGSFAEVGDLGGKGPTGLLYAPEGAPLVYFAEQNGVYTQVPNFIPSIYSISDVALADFNNDGYQDAFVVTKNFDESNLQQVNPTQVAAELRGSSNADRGFSFQTGGSITLDVQNIDSGVQSNQVFIGSSGYHPSRLPITLDPNNASNIGIKTHTAGQGGGLYLGYDAGTQTWQVLLSSSTVPNQGMVISATTPISALTPIGFNESQELTRNYLLIFNPQTGKLADETNQAGLGGLFSNALVVAGDFSNDMHDDLILTQENSIAALPSLYFHNNGDGTFTPMDVFQGQPTTAVAPAYPMYLEGRKPITADFNNDGMLDVFISGSTFRTTSMLYPGIPNQLWENQSTGNDWLELHLQGTVSNRDGVGAIVSVTAGGVTQVQEETDGLHLFAQNSSVLHFGLAQNTTVDKVLIQWPSGVTQEIDNVTADQLLQVVEPGGHTLATARTVPAYLSAGPYTGQVSGGNPSDYYRLGIAASTNLRIDLFQLAAPATLQLLDSAGNVLARSALGSDRKVLHIPVSAGTYYVRVRAGALGATTGYSLRLSDESPSDTQGPATSGVKLDDNLSGTLLAPTAPTIAAWVDDTSSGNTKIVAAEYFIDTVGAPGTGIPLTTSEGEFSGAIEYVTATLDSTIFANLSAGNHTLYLRGKDAAGNWGPTASADFAKDTVTHFVFTAPASVTAGTPFSITLTAQDASNGTVNGYRGTVTFSSSDGQALLPANYTFTAADAGVHTFIFTLETTGTQWIMGSDTVQTNITGRSSGITVTAAPASGAPSAAFLGTSDDQADAAIGDAFLASTSRRRAPIDFF
jgi:hypothetical protein